MFGRLLAYLKPYAQHILLLLIAVMVVAVLTLADAYILGILTDAIFYRTRGVTIYEKALPVKQADFLIRHREGKTPRKEDIRPLLSEKAGIRLTPVPGGTWAAVSDPAGFDPDRFAAKLKRGLKIHPRVEFLAPLRYIVSVRQKDAPAGFLSETAAETAGVPEQMISISGKNSETKIISIYFSGSINKLDPVQFGRRLQAAIGKRLPGAAVGYKVESPRPVKKKAVFTRIYTIILLPILIIIIYLIRGVFTFGQFFLSSYVGQKVIASLRQDVYEHVQRLSLSFFEKKARTGQIIARIINDISLLQYFLTSGVVEILLDPAVIILGIAAGFYLEWRLALCTFILIPLVSFPINRIGRMMRKVSLEIQSKIADLTSILQETITGIRVVKAFNMERHCIERFRVENFGNLRSSMRNARLTGILVPLLEFSAAFGLVLFIWYGGYLVLKGELLPSTLITFFMLVGLIANPVKKLSRLYGQIQHAFAASERIFEFLDQKPDVAERSNPILLPETFAGRVAFENVGFAYESGGPLVLSGINLAVNNGEVVALVGPSGAGKTTMANLILRFYDPTEGRVTVDGHDLRDLSLSSLRSKIGLVAQETILFKGTVAENILYGRPGASIKDVIGAAKAANAHNFISAMPGGYDAPVGERGQTLSGGQKQRIAIARALLKNPKILVLDEATSALDTESEKLVQQALDNLMEARTTFIIAHRLSTIRRAHRIIVLHEGRIVESGSHAELIKKDGLYKVLYETQFEA
ncbi:MAG: ABC transporter ATP-binding protein [Bacillota bacterium]